METGGRTTNTADDISKPAKRRRGTTGSLEDRVLPPLRLSTREQDGRGLSTIEDTGMGCIVLAVTSAAAVGLNPAAKSEVCGWCCAPGTEVDLCGSCGRVGFCSSCRPHRMTWHTTSGECSALQNIQTEDDGVYAATAALLIRAVLRADTCDDDADCFWNLTGSVEELNDLQLSSLELMTQILTPALPNLGIDKATAQLGLAKIAQNAHDFGYGRALWPRLELINHSCGPSAYVCVTATEGVGLSSTVRALREIPAGDAVTIMYRGVSGLHSSERKAELKAKYGWECKCEACVNGFCDDLLGSQASQGEIASLDQAISEAESLLAAGDAAGAAGLLQIFERAGERLQLGGSHKLKLRVLGLQRDLATATGDHAGAVVAARRWAAAAAPVEVMYPADPNPNRS